MDLNPRILEMNEHWHRRARVHRATAVVVTLILLGFLVFGALLEGWGLIVFMGIAVLGFAAFFAQALRGLRLLRKGLLSSSASPTTTQLGDGQLRVTDGASEIAVPLSAIRGGILVYDDNLDSVRGVDDALMVQIDDCRDLLISASASGATDVMAWLTQERTLRRIPASETDRPS